MSDSPPTPFDDEQLTDVLDGTAAPDLVAAVRADAVASERLELLRQVQQHVAAPPPDADPARRSQSIAAALASATPAEGVTSLSAARQTKTTKAEKHRRSFDMRWAAAVAAVVALMIAIPAAIDLSSDSDEATQASSDSATTTGQLNFPESDDADDAASEAGADFDTTEAPRDTDTDAMEDEPLAADESLDSTASADDTDSFTEGDADSAGNQTPTLARTLTSVEELAVGIDNEEVVPRFSIDDEVLVEAVSPDCLEPFADVEGLAFDLVEIASDDGTSTLVLVVFDDDGSTQTLEAEDCAPVG